MTRHIKVVFNRHREAVAVRRLLSADTRGNLAVL